MKLVVFGLAITSSWGNGHATTYRSLLKALNRRGHDIHFIEKDCEWYRNNRDLPAPRFCRVHLYDGWHEIARKVVRLCKDSDAVVIGSYFPDAINATEALLNGGCGPLIFYDIDTPITMAQLRSAGAARYLRASDIPHFAAYLSFTGGPVLRELEDRFGSPCAVPLYCSVDPEIHRPTSVQSEFRCDLSYLGTYAADRQPKLMQLLNETATMLPERRFIVAGAQYPPAIQWAPNVERMIHLSPPQHPAFYCSSRFTLNLTRDDMVREGYSPSVRLFEASACGAAILSDAWRGLEDFLTPNEELLIPRDVYEIRQILSNFPESERVRIGLNARDRVLSQHTAMHRAVEFEGILGHCASQAAAKGPTAQAKSRRVPDSRQREHRMSGPQMPQQ